MHASLNASLNENFKNEFLYQEEDSKSEFEEDGGIKSKLSQNNKLKSEFPHNDNLKSEFSHEENGGPCEHNNHDPMCYLQRLIHSQQVARNNYSQQLHNTSLFYYKVVVVFVVGMIVVFVVGIIVLNFCLFVVANNKSVHYCYILNSQSGCDIGDEKKGRSDKGVQESDG